MIRERIRNIVYQKMQIKKLKQVFIFLMLSASEGSEGTSSKIMLTIRKKGKNQTKSLTAPTNSIVYNMLCRFCTLCYSFLLIYKNIFYECRKIVIYSLFAVWLYGMKAAFEEATKYGQEIEQIRRSSK